MKDVYFHMLGFEGKIPDIYEFQDLGYVPDLLAKTRELFDKLGLPNGEDYIRQCGIDVDLLKTNSSGFNMRITNYPVDGSKTSWIYYNQFDDESIDIWNRAHEEAHAACHLGLRSELEKRIGIPNLSDLYEEDFCDQAGLYVLEKKGIEPNPIILIPYVG